MRKKVGWSVLLAICFWLAMPRVAAQTNNMQFSRPKDFSAIEQEYVFGIVQDQQGYLWYSTYSGLFRYDGTQLQQFRYDAVNKQALPGGPINVMTLTRNNHLWMGIQGAGIVDLDIARGSFYVYRHSDNDTLSINSNRISGIAEDATGNIWIADVYNGIGRIEPLKHRCTRYPSRRDGFDAKSAYTFALDKQGVLWIGSSNKGIYRLNTKTHRFDSIPISFSRNIVFPGQVEFMTFDKHGRLWCSTHSWVFALDTATYKCHTIIGTPYLDPEKEQYGPGPFLEDGERMWIGSYTGVYVYNNTDGSIIHYRHNESDPNSVNTNRIESFLKDRSNIIWIGTSEGVSKITPLQRNMRVYKHLAGQKASLGTKSIRGIYIDKSGTLWAGTLGEGLARLMPDGSWKHYLFNTHVASYGYNFVNYICGRRDGTLAIGTPYGIQFFDPRSNKFMPSAFSATEVKKMKYGYQTWAVWEDEQRRLWLGTHNKGLVVIDMARNQLKSYSLPDRSTGTFSVWSIFRDSRGRIWLGTDHGLARAVQGDTSIIISQVALPANAHTAAANIFNIYEDKAGRLWLGTSDAGLMEYDPASGLLNTYTSKDGLASDVISGILEDNRDQLWVSTLEGICVFDKHTRRVLRRYDMSDGLPSTHFNFKSCCQSASGEMFFGSSDGIVSFFPDSLAPNPHRPRVLITSFKTLYQEYIQQLLKDSSITLSYDHNTFSLEFSSDDYTSPENNIYAYKLAGLDKDWVVNQGRHYVAFNSIGPGTYTFMLKVANGDGVWGDKIATFKIRILPPLWRTWWFYTLCALAFISAVGFIIYTVLRSKDLKRKRVNAELAALRSQLNPHFVFNSLSSLQYFVAANQNSLAIEYLVKFARLMRMILENSTSDFISLQEEMDFLKLYTLMESLRLNDKVRFEIILDPALDATDTYLPSMMIQPLIENAIMHGLVAKAEDGYVKVHFKAEESCLRCEVEDNGIGMDAAAKNKTQFAEKKKSLGLQLVRERLKIISLTYNTKASINIIDRKNTGAHGTIVELKIPYLIFETSQPRLSIVKNHNRRRRGALQGDA